MVVKIRAITHADAAVWLVLRCALWPGDDNGHAAEIASFFAGTLEEPDAVLLAEDEAGRTVAHAELAIRPKLEGVAHGPVGYVEGLYVIPEVRNQGVAKQLLEVSRAWAKDHGCAAFASDRAGRVVIDQTF